MVWNWNISGNRYYSFGHFWRGYVGHPDALPLCFKKFLKRSSEKHCLTCFSGDILKKNLLKLMRTLTTMLRRKNYCPHFNGAQDTTWVFPPTWLLSTKKISALVICVILDTSRLQRYGLKLTQCRTDIHVFKNAFCWCYLLPK